MTSHSSNTSSPSTWLELIEHGDGYLTPEQRAAFEAAIEHVHKRLEVTFNHLSNTMAASDTFDFEHYITQLETQLIQDAQQQGDLEQDAALTAALLVTHIANWMQQYSQDQHSGPLS